MLIGSKHGQLLDWLAAQWLAGGPAMCFIEGFPGIGKTEIADALVARSRQTHRCVVVTFPQGQADPVTDFLWDLAGELDAPAIAEALGDRGAVTRELSKRLEEPILIIIDEFQRALQKNGEPLGDVAQLLERLGRAGGTPGRILLLTNRTVARGRWTERVEFRTLGRLDTADGVTLLSRLLAERGQEAEVPEERRADVVEWVGGNPRAIRTVVESLRYSPLDELIGLAPEIWRTEDRIVAPELVRELEKRLLEQIVPRLETPVQTALKNLAVHRRTFKKEAIEAISPNDTAAAETRSVLVDHFLLDHRSGNYSVTEVVREVVRRRLDDDPAALKAAHSRAADYYVRPFQAKQIVQSHRLGGRFIEARYHLVHAGREDDLQSIASRFAAELRSLYSGVSRVPTDAGERDERIAVLSALLETQGDKGLHYYLARLLKARGSAQDLVRALDQVHMAVGPQAPAATWVLLIELTGRIEGPMAALEAFRRGANLVLPEQNLVALYQSCGESLAREGRTGEAIDLLREGIGRIRPEHGLASLYQGMSTACNLAAQEREALQVLLEGIGSLPAGRFNRYRLEESAAQMALRLRDRVTLQTLREHYISGHQDALTEVFALQIDELWETAALKAKAARDTARNYIPLAMHEAFCWLAAGSPEQAAEALERFPGKIRPGSGTANSWLMALVSVLSGNMQQAQEALELYLDGPLKLGEEVDGRMLLRLWDESAGIPGPNPSYIFPHLPPSLTGLRETVTRLQHGPSVLPDLAGTRNEPGIRFLVVATEWNPGHGGLSSFNQALCRALARAGHTVHCLVPSASEEIAEARAAKVTLVPAPADLGDNPETRLIRRPALDHAPDVVIGHGRITGPAARVQATDYFHGSIRVHFVHTAPDHIEWFKTAPAEEEIAEKAEERTRIEVELSATAGLVVGVGPLLTDWIETRVRHGRGAEVSIHRLDPGLTSIRPGPGTPPPERVCLVLGRAEDEVLKGIDIAASAVAGLPVKDRPRLLVRGAPPGQADSLQVRISAAYAGVRVDVRRYTSDVELVEEDIRQSSLVLMPSRSEGFGLVGLEAISAGVPVLISGESGLGRLLREIVPNLAHHFVVDVLNVPGEDTATWRKEIEFALRDRNAAFERAWQLREALRPVLTWERAVERFLEELAPVLDAARAGSS